MEEEANSHFIFFTMCFTNLTQSGRRKDSSGFEGHKLYFLGNFSKVLKYSQEFIKASEKIIALQSIKRSKRTSSGMHTEQLIALHSFSLFLLAKFPAVARMSTVINLFYHLRSA